MRRGQAREQVRGARRLSRAHAGWTWAEVEAAYRAGFAVLDVEEARARGHGHSAITARVARAAGVTL